MPSIYSTLSVTEPAYGERIVRVHGGIHHAGVSQTTAVDLVTGERLSMPISTRWDSDTQRNVRVCADGWSWRPIPLAEAERRAGLPKGSLPPQSDTTRTDLWADERMRNPSFIALLTVLSAHPEVVFYSVDWRGWVHFTQPREYPHREDSAVLIAPTQTSGIADGRHCPYPLGGSGDMERYASSLSRLLSGPTSGAVDRAPGTFAWLSEAVLADLRDDYEDVVEWQRRPDPWHRLHRGPADMPVVRSLADIRVLAGWTPQLLAELDGLHDQTRARLAEETASYRPQSVALALF
jgi:hypothetical protein